MIEARLVTADSVILFVPEPRCGDVRVELAGRPTVQRLQYAYDMDGARAIGIPVRLVNVSGHAFSTPIDVRVDSAIAFRGARHRSQSLSWGFVQAETFSGREMQQPWRFVAASDTVGKATTASQHARALQPGEQTATRVVTVLSCDATSTGCTRRQMPDQPEDSTLARLLARRPNANDSSAILTVLAEWHPALRAAAVASVRASPRIRQLLAARFAATSATTTRGYEHQLLADPEIRRNEDALLVRANMTLARDDQELVYGASHRLPEGTFRRWEWPFTPVPVRASRDGRPAARQPR